MQRTFAGLLAIACCLTINVRVIHASTAAFGGKVVAVEDCRPNDKECLRQFTVEIDYYDYVSWGKFNANSKTGERITRKVRSVGTVAILNGRLTNAETLAAAMAPGQWGYFYEDTWHDLYTTPNFQWGEVVGHDAEKKQFQLRVHATHKEIHLDTNPPQVVTISYDDTTALRIEDEKSDAQAALSPGNWVQIHQPREQIVLVRTEDTQFDPSQLLPQEKGRRGYANDLSCPAVLKGFQTERPEGVIDIAVKLEATRTLRGKTEDVTLESRKLSFILDGKLAPVNIAVKPGRRAVLGYYRSQTAPHKVFVQSHDDAVRGTVEAHDAKSGTVTIRAIDESGKSSRQKITLEGEGQIQLNGRSSTASEALQKGREIVVHPQRGRTVIAFAPQE